VENNDCLIELDLVWTGIEIKKIKILWQKLALNTTLQSLSLAYNVTDQLDPAIIQNMI
jgi:hypothetical protein